MQSALTAEPPSRLAAEPSLISDLITLTKPRIISLLLLTTVAPMFITGQGLPSAGAGILGVRRRLSDGGRGQRHQHVVRPGHRRPDGAHPVAADPFRADLSHGRACSSARARCGSPSAVFWRLVNPLSAWLAMAGLLFYVLMYTMWLKRWGPQNIVIGGAAGAFPPLVGWAADDRFDRPGGDLPVRHHLLLDSAALLGPRPDQAK